MARHKDSQCEPATRSPSSRGAPTLTVGGEKEVRPRRLTPNDLLALDNQLRSPPFQKVRWQLQDDQGRHAGENLQAILQNVIWTTVKSFKATAHHSVGDGIEIRRGATYIEASTPNFQIGWSCESGCDREGVERAYRKVSLLLEALPAARGQTTYELVPSGEQRHWYDLRRAPESITDWLVIGIAASLAAGLVIAIILWRLG